MCSFVVNEMQGGLCTPAPLNAFKVVFYWDQPFLVGWVGWVFSCSIEKKTFSVG